MRRRSKLFISLFVIFSLTLIGYNVWAWYGYGTGFGTSSWSGFRIHTTTYYANNVYYYVTLRDVYTHIDNRWGTQWTNCALAKVIEGDGSIPVWKTHPNTQVPPGSYYIDYFWLGARNYYKYGQGVYTLSGATLTGNCGAFFGGWAVIFWPDGSITKEWRE